LRIVVLLEARSEHDRSGFPRPSDESNDEPDANKRQRKTDVPAMQLKRGDHGSQPGERGQESSLGL